MKIEQKGNKLVLDIDLTPEVTAQLSKSGKSKIAFTTGGFKYEGNLGISINVIYSNRKPQQRAINDRESRDNPQWR